MAPTSAQPHAPIERARHARRPSVQDPRGSRERCAGSLHRTPRLLTAESGSVSRSSIALAVSCRPSLPRQLGKRERRRDELTRHREYWNRLPRDTHWTAHSAEESVMPFRAMDRFGLAAAVIASTGPADLNAFLSWLHASNLTVTVVPLCSIAFMCRHALKTSAPSDPTFRRISLEHSGHTTA